MNRGRKRKRVSLDDDDGGGDDSISCFLHDHNIMVVVNVRLKLAQKITLYR